ncbi:50S ribosomal protein L21 [bacterium]|nr:50S ribosomal protein L21 [bacterium]
MYAIVEIAGKQYKVQENDLVDVDLLNSEKESVEFDKVLLISDGEKKVVGTPYVENAVINAEIVEEIKDEKLVVFKYLPKKDSRRKKGHRQRLSRVIIKGIKY